MIGLFVGDLEGILVEGGSVGEVVECDVGSGVGSVVGEVVGCDVGSGVGSVVGAVVGGGNEGEAVGIEVVGLPVVGGWVAVVGGTVY